MTTPVLIVDDSNMARKMLARTFPEEWDVEVSFATNGEEALAAYKEGKASIMFLDLTMPVMDGFQVLENLQHEANKPFVIVVSADIQPKAQQRVSELGAQDFLKKPITQEVLIETLKKHGIV